MLLAHLAIVILYFFFTYTRLLFISVRGHKKKKDKDHLAVPDKIGAKSGDSLISKTPSIGDTTNMEKESNIKIKISM